MSLDFVRLHADQKEVLLKDLNSLIQAAHQMVNSVQQNTLDLDEAHQITALMEFNHIDIAKMVGYESYVTKKREEHYPENREVNKRNHELEQKASLKPLDGLKEQLNQLSGVVSEWWKTDGFHCVNDFRFYSSGCAGMTFCFMLKYRYSTRKLPMAERFNKKVYVDKIKNDGYEIEDIEGYGLEVLDTPNNRSLLRSLLISRFPSIRINSFRNQVVGKNDDTYILTGIDATIFDLTDIPQYKQGTNPL
ncbi:hypothetical protein PPSC2_26460 (plasmid) [Paenibacillus polymyxa SC2]|uniref:Uncharacterized protein n=1 Tax=Paenibacillus polymyxa (strain SC2) TaxID=886882 RepID=E3EK35_PAEPS|nr:hypothetical protein PPSC2_26460 [Paenibacillus polymyxa SC2]